MAESNDLLRWARERVESPYATGDCLSRQELAELVNAWVYEHTGRVVELDANYVGKLEQGTIRWPQDPDRRAGLRAVLGVTAGFMADDDYAHDDAQRMYRFALACAEEAADWHLRAQVLASMAYQASWSGDLDTALAYSESALVRASRLTATERAMLHNGRARDLAKLGETQDALRAIGTADEEFSQARPAADPPWMASYTELRHLGFSGNNLWELGMHGQYVQQARERLTTSIATRAAGRARTRDQIRVASLIMVNGDPLEAAALGTQALDTTGPLRSRRALDDLRDLSRLAEPHTRLPEIADLRHRIRITVTA